MRYDDDLIYHRANLAFGRGIMVLRGLMWIACILCLGSVAVFSYIIYGVQQGWWGGPEMVMWERDHPGLWKPEHYWTMGCWSTFIVSGFFWFKLGILAWLIDDDEDEY